MKTRACLPSRIQLAPMARLILFAPSLAFAQQAAPSLATVMVTASRSQASVEQMPLHTTIVSQEDIEKSPAQTLDQLLRNVPGMNLAAVPAASLDPTGHQAKMRGLGNARVLVMLDGVPIHDPFFLTTQWFKVPLSNIERIEVVRGGNSSLWGNMAVAGVVNIISKRPKEDSAEMVVRVGNRGTASVAVSQNFVLSDTLALHFFTDVYHTNGYQTTPREFLYRFPEKQPVVADNKNIQLTVHVNPSATVSGYVRLGYHVQDQQLSYKYGRNLQESPDLAAHIEKTFGNDSSVQANAWAQYLKFDKLNGNTCYYQGGGNCLTSSNPALTPDTANDYVVQFYTQQGLLRYREQGASLIYATRFNSPLYSLEAGVDYRRLSAKDSETFFNTPATPDAPQARIDSSTHGEGRQQFRGLFAQVKFAPFDALDITLSGRLDRYDIGKRSSTRTLPAGASTGGALPDAKKTAFNPGVAVRFTVTDRLSVRAAGYKAFRAPGFNNLTRTFGTGSNTTIANPDLVPENLRGWEAGSDYRGKQLTFGATYFRSDIAHMIATFTANSASAPQQVQAICGGPSLPTCAGSARYYTNDQDGRSQGVELVAGWRWGDRLALDAQYTHTRTYLTRRGAVVTDPLNVQLAGVPKNVASIGATWRPTSATKAYVQARYTGPMLLDTTSNGGTTRFRQGGTTVINASFSYAMDEVFDFFAGVSNLLNRVYGESPYAIDQPYNRILSMPRTFTAGVRARF